MTATTEVRAAHRFDEVALRDWLAARIEGVGPEMRLRQFSGGQSNPTFLIETGARRLVLRKQPPGELLPSAHQVDREYRVMAALADTGVPVPPVLALCLDRAVIGTDFYVMDRVEGRVITDPAMPGAAPGDRAAVYAEMARVLARLHGLDWAALGLSDFGKHEGYIERQLRLWTRQYEAARTGDIPQMDRLGAHLAAHLPASARTTIAHGDYRLGNLMLHPAEPRIVAVLDWELSTLGDPLADLAYCCLPWHLPADVALLNGLPDEGLAALGIPEEAAFLETYRREAGLERIDDWPFYLGFALFRLAAICQGVYKRALSGNAADPSGERHGALVPVFAQTGCRVLGLGA